MSRIRMTALLLLQVDQSRRCFVVGSSCEGGRVWDKCNNSAVAEVPRSITGWSVFQGYSDDPVLYTGHAPMGVVLFYMSFL